MEKISVIQSGVSGEYFVAAELSRRGFICSITLKNTKGIDVLVLNEHSKKLVGVQVKTNNSSRKAWLLTKKQKNYQKIILYMSL
jgi:predicted AAA+ superfamily ATPase